MKKSILLGMPKLTASPEMKKVALEDEPEKVRTYSGYTRIRRKYKCYMNCMVQNGILKVALYLPDHLRWMGTIPPMRCFLIKRSANSLPMTIWIRSGEIPSWTDWNGLDRIMMRFAG